jgi:hypothetical protein
VGVFVRVSVHAPWGIFAQQAHKQPHMLEHQIKYDAQNNSGVYPARYVAECQLHFKFTAR